MGLCLSSEDPALINPSNFHAVADKINVCKGGNGKEFRHVVFMMLRIKKGTKAVASAKSARINNMGTTQGLHVTHVRGSKLNYFLMEVVIGSEVQCLHSSGCMLHSSGCKRCADLLGFKIAVSG